MTSEKEFRFAEVLVDRLFLESFSNEQSAYHSALERKLDPKKRQKLLSRLKWHIKNTLSKRQREVLKYYLKGKKEREIAEKLGVTQQVVNIYKQRAIRKLTKALLRRSVC
jgi:DNA-binding NarL/FixJ family response regulator